MKFTFNHARRGGFTLIEVLVAVGLLITIAGLSSTLFITVLKNASKTKVDQVVKQEGDYALLVMSRMIRNAREVVEDTTYVCAGSSSQNEIAVKNADEGITVFSCQGDYLASSSGSLVNGSVVIGATDRLTSSRVQVLDCASVFTCLSGTEFEPDQVAIGFSMTDTLGSARKEEQTSLNFATNVTVRNF